MRALSAATKRRRTSPAIACLAVGLLVAACGAGQTQAATTLRGVPPPTTQIVVPSTTQPNTAVVTGKVFPCSGQPRQLPEADFNSVFLDTPGEEVVAPAPVQPDHRFVFNDVRPGRYELAEGPSASPLIVRPVSVHGSETLVVDLPGCVPTAGGNYKPASAAAVRRFLSKAQSDDQGFAATYRNIDSVVGPQTFFYAQQPQGRGTWSPHGTGDFTYAASEDDESFKFVQRDRGDYACLQKRRHASWTCDGPNEVVRSIGDYYQTAQFDEEVSIATVMVGHMSPIQAWIWSGQLRGLTATCLRYIYPASLGSRATWCIDPAGITLFVVAPSVLSLQVTRLSTAVPAADFSLPAKPGPWRGACMGADVPPGCSQGQAWRE
jgi:hypothetical protein